MFININIWASYLCSVYTSSKFGYSCFLSWTLSQPRGQVLGAWKPEQTIYPTNYFPDYELSTPFFTL